MNAFDSLYYGEMSGFFSKIGKSLARFRDKVHGVLEKVDPLEKFNKKVRDKVEGSPTGRAVLQGVAGYFGGPAAAAVAKTTLEQGQVLKQEKKIKAANKKFLQSPEGQQYLETKKKFDQALQEIKADPKYRAIYDDLRGKGFTDQQIAAEWIRSKPAREVAKAATAEVMYPRAVAAAQQSGVPRQYIGPVASKASMDMANDAVEKQANGGTNWLPIAIMVGSLFLFGQ